MPASRNPARASVMSVIEMLAVVITMAGIWLTGQRKVMGWPVSLMASLLYLVVFARAQLWADSVLQVIFCLFLIKGWHDWRLAPKESSAVIVQPALPSTLVRDLLLGSGASLVGGVALARWTNDPAPLTDATLSVFSIIGQIWTARRFMACWPLWMMVDGAYVGLFITREMWMSAGLYAGLIILAGWGWLSWRRETRRRGD